MTPPQNIERVLTWPRETWTDQEHQMVQEYRASVHGQMRQLVDEAERWNRSLTDEELQRFTELEAEFDRL